jgi:hypothetical protein
MNTTTLPCHAMPTLLPRTLPRGYDAAHVIAKMRSDLELLAAFVDGAAPSLVADAMKDLTKSVAALEAMHDAELGEPPTLRRRLGQR